MRGIVSSAENQCSAPRSTTFSDVRLKRFFHDGHIKLSANVLLLCSDDDEGLLPQVIPSEGMRLVRAVNSSQQRGKAAYLLSLSSYQMWCWPVSMLYLFTTPSYHRLPDHSTDTRTPSMSSGLPANERSHLRALPQINKWKLVPVTVIIGIILINFWVSAMNPFDDCSCRA